MSGSVWVRNVATMGHTGTCTTLLQLRTLRVPEATKSVNLSSHISGMEVFVLLNLLCCELARGHSVRTHDLAHLNILYMGCKLAGAWVRIHCSLDSRISSPGTSRVFMNCMYVQRGRREGKGREGKGREGKEREREEREGRGGRGRGGEGGEGGEGRGREGKGREGKERKRGGRGRGRERGRNEEGVVLQPSNTIG